MSEQYFDGYELVKSGIFVDITDKGMKVKNGVIIPDDGFSRERGVRPRVCLVLAVSDEAREAGIEPGDEVLISHGEWTRQIMVKECRDGQEHGVWYSRLEKILMHKKGN